MKNSKNILIIMLSLFILFVSVTPVNAMENFSNGEIMNQVAEETIQKTQSVNENGLIVVTYTNLDQFIECIHENYEDITDYEIALYIRQYTKQIYEGLSEAEIVEILLLDNITTSVEYVTVDELGNVMSLNSGILPRWIDSTRTIEITTSYSYRKTVGNEKYYKIWASATWLDKPTVAIKDVFGLGTSGTFDSGYTAKASVYQTLQCLNGCTSKTYDNRSVQANDEVDGDLKMHYAAGVPTIEYVPANASCSYCLRNTKCTYLSTYIEYGMITDESVNIQAGYGHSIVNCNVSISFDYTGKPSITPTASPKGVPYIALPVTVYYS